MSDSRQSNGSARFGSKLAVLARELRESLSPSSRAKRSLRDAVPYDSETQRPIIRASICTGERVAGFKSRTDGHFTEVMLVRSVEDEREFMEAFGIDSLETEY